MALTDTFIKQTKSKGKPNGEKYADGGGLYLHIIPSGRYWRMAYRYMGKQKTLALGVYPTVSLVKARQRRDEAKALLSDGTDPGAVKKERRAIKENAVDNTFRAIAMEWHLEKSKRTSASTTGKRLAQLETHIFPSIGALPITTIEPLEIGTMLKAISDAGAPYTATRVRETCGQVFRHAIQWGKSKYDPTTAMKGVVVRNRVVKRPALTTPKEFGQFVRDLHNTTRASKLTRLCARLAMLTWTRPGELRQARWDQFDEAAATWYIPAIAMKTGKNLQAHSVPLCKEALDTLTELRELTGHVPILFPGTQRQGSVISENTVNLLFKRIGYEGRQSHHGLRASARSMLSERGWAKDALERQLDHKEADESVAAYARGEHMEERRNFMNEWGKLISDFEQEQLTIISHQ